MKIRKTLCFISFIMTLTLLAAACGKKSDSTEANNLTALMQSSGGSPLASQNGDTQYTAVAPAATSELDQEYAAKDSGSGVRNTYSLSSGISDVQPQDKIIRTFNLDVETQDFDKVISTIDSEIKRLGGYVENSKIIGEPYYYGDNTRNGSIIARIPSDKVDEFVNIVRENSNIINRQESTSNVSLQYIEAESRIETLKIEQDRLFAILEKEINLDNIITLESRLGDIRYELQNYESQIRYYDNQVAYSTVTMSIEEVEKLTPVTEVKPTLGTRIKNGFSDTMNKISVGLQDFCVWFIVNLPYLIIWAIIIIVFVICLRRYLKKSKARKVAPLPMINYVAQNNGLPNQTQGSQGQQIQNQQIQNPPSQNQHNQN